MTNYLSALAFMFPFRAPYLPDYKVTSDIKQPPFTMEDFKEK
jgi:hypothetical protein